MLTAHIHETYYGRPADKQTDVQPGGVGALTVSFTSSGTVSWLIGNTGHMLVVLYHSFYNTYLGMTLCPADNNSDWCARGVLDGDHPKFHPYSGILPNIGKSVGQKCDKNNSEESICLEDDQFYVTAKFVWNSSFQLYAVVRLYPKQVGSWSAGLRETAEKEM